MTRTFVDIIGDYYDSLDKIVDWAEEIDIRHYDISQLSQSINYPNDL